MKIYKNGLLAAALLLAVSNVAYAGNDNANPCGNNGNNCGDGDASSVATGGAGGTGVGFGGSATGGSVGDVRNTSTNLNNNTALGGQGGAGGKGGEGGNGYGFGGSAHQGQNQGQQQGQSQGQSTDVSNVGLNSQGQSLSNSTSTTTSTSTSTSSTNGQSQSANNAGNSQSVGGQSVTINEADIPDDVTIRSAPTMMVSAPNATASCFKPRGLSLSVIGGGGGYSGGSIDEQCEFRETVRIAAAVDPSGAVKMLCLNQMYSAANASKCAGVRPVFLFEGVAGKQYKANVAADAK